MDCNYRQEYCHIWKSTGMIQTTNWLDSVEMIEEVADKRGRWDEQPLGKSLTPLLHITGDGLGRTGVEVLDKMGSF